MLLHKELTDMIIKAFYVVYNELGYGFLESIYEKAMLIELRNMGLNASSQELIHVHYSKEIIGRFKAMY